MFGKSVIFITAVGILLSTAACNTVKGLGKDIQSVGAAGEKAIK